MPARAPQEGDVIGDGAYKLGAYLGQGRFSVVFACHPLRAGARVKMAAKIPKRSYDKDAREEVAMMRACHLERPECPLVRMLDVVEPCTVVMESMDGGDLMDRTFAWPQLCALYAQACRGVAWLHARGHLHCDIKPENMLLNADQTVLRLCDVGNAQKLHLKNELPRSTFYYRSPETLLRLAPYGPEVDVWALGCCAYESFTGEILFDVDDLTEEDDDDSSSYYSCTESSGSEASTDQDKKAPKKMRWESSSSSESEDEEKEQQETLAHLGQVQALCGVLPKAWRQRKRKFFNARGQLFAFDPPPPFGSMVDKIEHDCPTDKEKDIPRVLALLQPAFRYKKRASVQELHRAFAVSAQ